MAKELNRINSEYEEVLNLILKGIDCWMQAGEKIAACIDRDAKWVDNFCDKYPRIGRANIVALELVGRKQLLPQLLTNTDAPGWKRLRNMPISLQEKYVNDPVELLLADGETLLVDPINLSKEQADQVFDKKTVRTPEAQRAWLEAKATKASAKTVVVDDPYRVTGKYLVIMQPCKFDARQLAQLLTQLT